jgi:hypothetical protein
MSPHHLHIQRDCRWQAFEEAQDILNAAIENEAKPYGPQESYRRPVKLMNSLPTATQTAIRMPDGYWV